MNEVVKYDNYFNKLPLKNFNKAELDFLMVLCAKMRDKDCDAVVFDFAQLRALSKYSSTDTDRFIKDICETNRKLKDIYCEIENEEELVQFVLFPTFRTNKIKRTLTVRVNPDFKFILNEITNNFTRFELDEFVNLKSKYSKNLYRQLKQFRKTGVYKVNIDELRKKLDVPNSYENKIFIRDLLKPAVKELSNYFINLKLDPKKDTHKRGKPVVGYIFTFEAEQIKKKPTLKEEPKTIEPQEQNYHSWIEQAKTQMSQTGRPQTKEIGSKKMLNHKFNQFPQRNYTKEDYAEIERRLLNRKN